MLFQTESEEEYLRAHKLAADYKITPWFRGSGQEYRLVDVLKGRTAPLIVPVNFPDAPEVANPEAAMNATLAQLRHWYLAPTNPAQLAKAGVSFALTTDGLSSLNQFLPNLRIAVARGLSRDKALEALTTVPATWLGIERTHGTIAAGKVANLVIADGDLFTRRIECSRCLGAGHELRRHSSAADRSARHVDDRIRQSSGFRGTLELEGTLNRIRGTIEVPSRKPITLTGVASSRRQDVSRRRSRASRSVRRSRADDRLAFAETTFFGWASFQTATIRRYWHAHGSFKGPARGTMAMKVPKIDLPLIRPIWSTDARPCPISQQP